MNANSSSQNLFSVCVVNVSTEIKDKSGEKGNQIQILGNTELTLFQLTTVKMTNSSGKNGKSWNLKAPLQRSPLQ